MKIRNQIAIGIVCVLLGIILALQYKVFQDSLVGGDSLFKKQTDLTNELFALKEEKQTLILELNKAHDILSEIEESASKDNAIIKNLTDTVHEYEILAGMTEVSGEGVIITIDNPPVDQATLNDVNIVNQYEQIVKLVNELNASGAEAISINEQRIIALSEIRAAGSSINVNFVPQTTPLVIKAIGKKSALEGALTFRYGQVTLMREASLLVDIKTVDEVIIPRYHGLLNFQYVKTVEDE